MTRQNRIKELLAAGDFVGLDLYMRANIEDDSDWEAIPFNSSGTIIDYSRVVAFKSEPDTYELERIMNSINVNYKHAWSIITPRIYRFTATLDTSD